MLLQMMSKIKIPNKASLVQKLSEDVINTKKNSIVFQAGHFPLSFNIKSGSVREAPDRWDPFSKHSLEVALEVANNAREVGKETKFVFFVDDHKYFPNELCKDVKEILRNNRDEIYSNRTGHDAKLMPLYEEMMKEHGFGTSDVIRQDGCLLFSETKLRESGIDIRQDCAREYVEFLSNGKYFNMNRSYMVSFVPRVCEGFICDIALESDQVDGVESTHIFMENMDNSIKKSDQLYTQGRGVIYRKE